LCCVSFSFTLSYQAQFYRNTNFMNENIKHRNHLRIKICLWRAIHFIFLIFFFLFLIYLLFNLHERYLVSITKAKLIRQWYYCSVMDLSISLIRRTSSVVVVFSFQSIANDYLDNRLEGVELRKKKKYCLTY